MAREAVSVEVTEVAGIRICITTYANGDVVRTAVDPSKKATRKPRIRRQKMRKLDYTRKKQF